MMGDPARLVRYAVTAAAAAIALLVAAPTANGAKTIRASGRFQCRLATGPVDIPYASVKMLNRNFTVWADETMGRSTTSANGAFSFTGRGGDAGIGRGTRPDP